MDIPSLTQPPCYPLGEGNHFHSRKLFTSASGSSTRHISQRPTPPKSPVPIPPPPGPSRFGERDFKPSTILERQSRSKTALATRLPTSRVPTPPIPSYSDRAVPPESVTSISTSTSTYPPHLPKPAPTHPTVTEPQPGHEDPHPYFDQAPPIQRQPHPPQHDHSQRASEPAPAPVPPSPGPSFTSTPPASVRGPSPSPLLPSFAHDSLLSMQARRFVARVEKREQADREDGVARMRWEDERGRKERRWKGFREGVRWLFRGGGRGCRVE